MGAPMARNLLKAGFEVTVWNRSIGKAVMLAGDGAIVSQAAEGAVGGAQVVISMLSDGDATAEVIGKTGPFLAPGTLWIDMSSIKPEQARTQGAALAEKGHFYIDAPVSGGTKGAEAATLAIMAGGDAAVFARAEPVLAAMGRAVHVGPNGSGQLSKLANQAIVAVTIGAVAEAMLLLREGGADPAAVRDALKGGFADSTILQQHGARMTEGDFAPGGLSKLQLKDVENALAEARGVNLTLPITEHIRDRFDDFVNKHDGADKDHSGLYLELLARNELSQ